MSATATPARAAAHADLQGYGTCAALLVEGYLLMALAEPANTPFLVLLAAACGWRMFRIWVGESWLVDWSRPTHRLLGSAAYLLLGFGTATVLTAELVYFLAAVVVWVQVLILLSRWRGSGILRALTYLSLLHVALAAFVVRPAATAPLLLVYLFLVVRTLGVADRRAGDVPEQQRFWTVDLGTFAAVSLVAITLFLVLPRPGAWATSGAADPSRHPGARDVPVYAPSPGGGSVQIGFGDDMDLNDITELITDKRLAMRVGSVETPPQFGFQHVLPELRLRGIAFQNYRDGQWWRGSTWRTIADGEDAEVDGAIRVAEEEFGPDPSVGPGLSGAAPASWSAVIELEPLGNTSVFVPPGVRVIRPAYQSPNGEEGCFLKTDSEEGYFFPIKPQVRVTYKVEAALQSNYRAPEARVRRFLEGSPYLAVEGARERYRLLAQDLILGRSTDLARIVTIRDWLRDEGGFRYSLSVPLPPEGVDPVDDFVWETKSGFCVHFSTAMVLLLRSIGIPCRVAGGYLSGEYDPERKEFLVRQSHAHAWVEIPFEGLGWVPFDPTPLPRNAEDVSLGDLSREVAAGPRSSWSTFLVDLESFDRGRFVREIGQGAVQLWDTAVGRGGAPRAMAVWGFGVLAIGLLMRSLRRVVALARRRGTGESGAPVREVTAPAAGFFRELLRVGVRRGVVREPHETPEEYARRLDRAVGGDSAARVVRHYYNVAFGRRALGAEEQASVRVALAELDATK